ncbi:Receptor-like kinase [Arachis hypogaea]|nr:Receptor-like kinase [Arachis hypogaea]
MCCVESNDDEGAYMFKLMNALKPPGWSNTTHMCLWRGVTCNDQSGRIEVIDLRSMSLTGTVPAGLNDSLSQLTVLDLSHNNLSGPVPSLANLSFLQLVYLHNNNFTSIPHGCFHGLTTLLSLWLTNNTNLPPWNFPTDLTAHSSQLRFLHLSSTNLMGSLPNISHSFPSMSRLDLSNNNLSSIPEGCFHNLTSLYVLSLANNTNLPPWTFPLDLTHSSLQLSYLYLEATNLMGSLPNLSHFFPDLNEVSLSNNHLSFIPQGCFQGLPGLVSLNLGNNTNLTPWTFPNLTHSTQLKDLNLTATNVMGSLPEIFHSLPSMETVLLSNNNLSGVLPESFGGTKIATLHLNNQKGNGFSGPIDVLSNMLDLSQVWLQGNSFTGPIPDMSHCAALQDLQLGYNQLTGVVPDSLTTLDLLQRISLNNNFLQGPLPEFAIYPEENVNLGVNTTNGFCHKDPGPCDHKVTILLQIAAKFNYPILLARTWRGNNACKNWSFITCDDKNKIRMVNLSNLKLTGTISPAFANLTDLRKLYLDGNNLTGEIPEGLTTLHELEVVNVSNNHLAGNIPKFSPKVNFIATGNDFPVLASNGRIPTALITGLSAASVGILITCVVVIYKSKRLQKIMFKKTIVDRNVEDLIQSYGFMVQKRYSYSQVKRMTNFFGEKLGQGGFGVVYKGSLSDGRHVAVKILKESKGNGEEFNGEEFINEVANFCPKIADFGLAKICTKKESIVSLQYARGTVGYVAPEVYNQIYSGVSRVSHKSDVYSYGKLILEVIGGKENYNDKDTRTSEIYFTEWIYKELEQDNLSTRCLTNTENENDLVKKIILVGMWCIQRNPSDRPSMKRVIEMLEGLLDSIPFPPKPMWYSPQGSKLQSPDIAYDNTHEPDSSTSVQNDSINPNEFA